MSSDRSILVAALLMPACLSQEGPRPPAFPGGGLLAVAAALPVFLRDGTTPVLAALDGVYDTSSRFGASVVLHSSTWGDVGASVQASLAVLARDHFAIALLRGGCLDAAGTGPGTDSLVFEGYWRYLDDPDPSPSVTGLVRLFVQPAAVAQQLCRGEAAIAPGSARLVGATGNGDAAPGVPLEVSYLRARKSKSAAPGDQRFFVGMHHGACVTTDNCGISENTPETLVLAKQLGADYSEVNVRLTADKVPVSFHLNLSPAAVQGVHCVGHVEDYTYDQLLANCRLRNGEIIPRLADLLAYGLRRTNLPFYLDVKSTDAIVPTSAVIADLARRLEACSGAQTGGECLFPGSAPVMARAVMGLPAAEFVSAYKEALAAGQLAPGQRCLVEEDPADVLDTPCIAWMPRYTRGPMRDMVQELQSAGKFAGYWTINDPATMDAFLTHGVPNGILTDYLGLLNQRWEEVGILPEHPLAP